MVVCDVQMSRKYKLYLLYSSLSSFYDFLPSATVMKSPDVVSLSRERVSSAYSFGGPCPTLGKPSALGNCWDAKGKEDAAKQPAHFMAKCGKEKGRCWSHSPLRASASHPRTSHQALPASHSPTSKCWHLRTKPSPIVIGGTFGTQTLAHLPARKYWILQVPEAVEQL